MKTSMILFSALFSMTVSASEATLTQFFKALQGSWHGQNQVNSQDGIAFYDLDLLFTATQRGVWSAKNTEIDRSTPGAVYVTYAGLHVDGNQLSISGPDGSLKTVQVTTTTPTSLVYSVEALDPNANLMDTITSQMDIDLHGTLHGHDVSLDGNGKTISDETFTLNR